MAQNYTSTLAKEATANKWTCPQFTAVARDKIQYSPQGFTGAEVWWSYIRLKRRWHRHLLYWWSHQPSLFWSAHNTASTCTFLLAREFKSKCCQIVKVKGKNFPYSIPCVGPGDDPSVQAVSLQVTVSHPPGGRLPLLFTRPAVTFPATQHHSVSADCSTVKLMHE